MNQIEEAVVHDLAAAPVPPPVDRIRRRAQRRRARVRTTGLAVLVAVGLAIGLVARSSSRSSRVAVRPAFGAAAAPSDVVVFDDNGGVSAVNFAARTVTHFSLAGWRGGDQPFLSLRVGTNLVAGWGHVYATPLSGGPSHALGTGVMVPAVEPGAVWLTSYGTVQTPTERLVDMHGKVLLQGPTPHYARGGAYIAITGAPGGLVMQTDNGLAIWDARTGRITRRLGSGPGVTAVPMSGSLLAWCDHCDRTLELTDLATGATRSIAVSLDGGSLRMERYFAFSPDGTQLAVPAQPDGAAPLGATTRIIIVDVTTAKVASQIDARARYATIAWSPDSERLYIAASDTGSGGRVLVHDQPTNTTRDLGPVPDQSGSFSTILTPNVAARLSAPTTPTTSAPVSQSTTRTTCAAIAEGPATSTATGTLRMVGGPPGATKQPVDGTVTIMSSSGQSCALSVGADGQFAVSLAPGTYRFTGHSPKFNGGSLPCSAGGPVFLPPRRVTSQGPPAFVNVDCQRR